MSLFWPHRPRACPCPVNSLEEASRLRNTTRNRTEPLGSQAYGFLQRRLDAGFGWSSSCSLNHNLLFPCSSHVLSPSARRAEQSFPSWRNWRSSCLSELLAAKMETSVHCPAGFLPCGPLNPRGYLRLCAVHFFLILTL